MNTKKFHNVSHKKNVSKNYFNQDFICEIIAGDWISYGEKEGFVKEILEDERIVVEQLEQDTINFDSEDDEDLDSDSSNFVLQDSSSKIDIVDRQICCPLVIFYIVKFF